MKLQSGLRLFAATSLFRRSDAIPFHPHTPSKERLMPRSTHRVRSPWVFDQPDWRSIGRYTVYRASLTPCVLLLRRDHRLSSRGSRCSVLGTSPVDVDQILIYERPGLISLHISNSYAQRNRLPLQLACDSAKLPFRGIEYPSDQET